ncbi:MAG: DUF4872 domain-containing protein [Caldilineaceae bacterium]
MTLDQPDPDKLAAAVTAGIWDCINLFLEKPPKGSAQNWGIKALQHWAELLTKPKQRLSWEKVFPAGHKMYAGLLTAFDHYGVTGIRDNAERELYADFLDEAALLLKKAPLHEVAGRFRESSTAWRKLAEILLPDPITPFGQSRKLVQQRQDLFLTQGNAAQGTIQQINEELRTIRATMATDFPLTPSEVTDQRSAIAEQLRQIGEIELNAVTALRAIMAAK